MELSGPVSGHFFAGNDHEWEFTVTEDSVAVDITGMTFRFVMARRPGGTDVLSTESSPVTAVAAESTPLTGKFTITVTNADTESLLGTYQFQAQVEDLSGNKSNVLHGYYTFKANMI
jgi:hypothetical protein